MKQANNLTDQRESFVFYRSFLNAIERLPKSKRIEIYEAIIHYSLNRVVPKLSGTTLIMWELIVPQLDANWRKYSNGCRGGGVLGNQNAKKRPKNDQKRANDNVNENENVNVNVNDNVAQVDTTTTTTSSSLALCKPTLSEVQSYILEHTLSVNAEYFFNYYTSTGWMMGRRPMKDWQATLQNWHKLSDEKSTLLTPQTPIYNDL